MVRIVMRNGFVFAFNNAHLLIIWALIFTTLGYLGGEAIGPWLHHLDAHLKHWIWLILAVALVVAAHWWLKHREAKKKE